RFWGYSANDSDALRGMHNRSWSIDAGGRLIAVRDRDGASFTAVHDILGRHSGDELTAMLFHRTQRGFARAALAAGLVRDSRNLVNYYFGVRPNEATVGRPAYGAGSM